MFKNKFSFDDLLKSYVFDRKLRALFIEALEIVEIALRNSMADSFSTFVNDELWIYDSKQFGINYSRIYTLIRDNVYKATSKALDIDFVETPMSEIVKHLPFGVLVSLYEELLPVNRDFIANNFNLNNKVMGSWIGVLSSQRNICAHYTLFWSRIFGKLPINLNMGKEYDLIFDKSYNKLFAQFYVTAYFLYLISPSSSWVSKVRALIEEYTVGYRYITFDMMGFPTNWKNFPLFAKMLRNQ